RRKKQENGKKKKCEECDALASGTVTPQWDGRVVCGGNEFQQFRERFRSLLIDRVWRCRAVSTHRYRVRPTFRRHRMRAAAVPNADAQRTRPYGVVTSASNRRLPVGLRFAEAALRRRRSVWQHSDAERCGFRISDSSTTNRRHER